MIRILPSLRPAALGLAAWCLAAGCLDAGAARAACSTRQVASLPLTFWHDKLLVSVSINGAPETMALDTGAGITAISSDAAGRLNIPHDFDHHAELGGVGGANSALFIGQPDAFDLGAAHLAHPSFPIIDMTMQGPDGQKLAGLLGGDILSHFDIELDLQSGQLGLWRDDGCDAAPPPWDASAETQPIDIDDNHHILVPLRVDGAQLTAVLDTGASGFDLSMRAGMRAGATEDALDADPEIHGVGVNDRSWTGRMHRFQTITFAGKTFHSVWTALIPGSTVARDDAMIGADGLAGMGLLKGMRLWISYRTKSFAVAP